MRAMKKALFASLAAGLALAACADPPNATYSVQESVGQLFVTHAQPGQQLTVFDRTNATIATGMADNQGSLIFRELPPGDGYTVRSFSETTGKLTVMSVESSQPSQKFYTDQKLAPGFGYIKMRDGTTLSAYIAMPGPPEMGPYPTVVSYSGYSPSRPGAPLGDYGAFCLDLPTLCDAPDDPGSLIAGLYGYATVSVNMRGTGCSGGAFDYFEKLQRLDGYDVIEAVAAQPWVMNHKVGMVGLSYPGISQLFVAAEKPPGLAAITPLSVIGNSATTIKPGGILNDGFALSWVTRVIEKAAPYGQGWEQGVVDKGDLVCKENQLLHGQLIDNVAQARALKFYDPALHERYNPSSFVGDIEVPVFIAGAYQDEQTGPYFSTLLDRFTGTAGLRMNIYNGVHPDGFAPQVMAEWFAFLEIFVAQRKPVTKQILLDLSPLLFKEIFGADVSLAKTKWETDFTDYATVKAAWLAAPKLRVLFESGAGVPANLGAPVGAFERDFASWPPPEAKVKRLYFQADGSLGDAAPTETASASSFHHDPGAGQRGILAPGGRIWDSLPDYDWKEQEADTAVVFVSAPLAADTVMVGPASVDLWLKSNSDDADLEANLIEVRPDGQEMYVQSGWLRASFRKPGSLSTELFPQPTYTEADWSPLVPGEWTQARVGIPGFGHVFRAGSRIKIAVDTPGDSRAEWRFNLNPDQTTSTRHTIGHDTTHPSSIALPALEGVTAGATLPPCPSLRGQQCRATATYTNTPAN